MDVIIVFVLLISPLVVIWLARGQQPLLDAPPPSPARDTGSWLPAQQRGATPVAAIPDGMSWSALDDYQVARLLSGSDPRTSAD